MTFDLVTMPSPVSVSVGLISPPEMLNRNSCMIVSKPCRYACWSIVSGHVAGVDRLHDRQSDVPDRCFDLALQIVLLDELRDRVAVTAVDGHHELDVLVARVPRGDLVVLRRALGCRSPDLNEVDAGRLQDRLRAVESRLDVPRPRSRDDSGDEVALSDPLPEDRLPDRGAGGEVVLADVGQPVVDDSPPRRRRCTRSRECRRSVRCRWVR